MPGAVPIDEDTIKPESAIAYKDNNDQWRAGPDAPGYEQGQFVPTREVSQAGGGTRSRPGGNVGRSYTTRRRTNLVKANMRKRDMSEEEARDFVNERLDEMEEARKEGDTEQVRDIRQSLHGS